MASIRVRFGRPRDIGDVTGRVEAATIRGIAEEIVNRVQDRVDHPAADSLTVKGINQHAADIIGPRGGPGLIKPVNRKALFWVGLPHPVASAQGVGFEPLMKAEAERIRVLDLNIVVP